MYIALTVIFLLSIFCTVIEVTQMIRVYIGKSGSYYPWWIAVNVVYIVWFCMFIYKP